MTHHVALQFAVKTDTGLVRAHNEDAVGIHAGYGMAVLADGMGGYNAGEIASSIAIAAFMHELERQLAELQDRRIAGKRLQQAMADAAMVANRQILDAARKEPQYSGMGTTLVAALLREDRVVLAHVGDSRCYRFRQGALSVLTRDHSLLQEQIDAGLVSPEWARYAPNKNLITRALGVAPQIEVETGDHPVEQGDVYLLCSDGLSDMLSSAQMMAMLETPDITLDQLGDLLVRGANDNGGRDNISVILIRVVSAAESVLEAAPGNRWQQWKTRCRQWLPFRSDDRNS